MRSYRPAEDLLVAAAKKKPRLQALLDELPTMSLEDIEALAEPVWVREGLSNLKKSNGQTQADRIAALLARTIAAEEAAKLEPKPLYEVYVWTGTPRFFGNSDPSHSWQIEISTGDSFQTLTCPASRPHADVTSQVKFGDSLLRIGDDDFNALIQGSQYVGYMTSDNYRGFHRELLNQKHRNL